ncbi:hypothetical protein [Corynebacterium pacaense]|uniref:hypothetical protein n=1 Tax=Corynebacterium pacaense TaxID=1816684 RepID=UPI0009BADB4A|nr:hypothetical protein [Corynebacterium pacaense]
MALPHVIFLGHGSIAEQIRGNLLDLAAMGLIDAFTWIDPRCETSRKVVRVATPASGAEPESVEAVVTLDDALQRFRGGALLIALDADEDGHTLDLEGLRRWTGEIDHRLNAATVTPRVRVLIPRLPLDPVEPAHEMGWSTLAIAPTDSESASPDSRTTPVLRAGDPVDIARLAAPTLASLSGLWSGSRECALIGASGEAISTGDQYTFRYVRAFHRNIDASEVEAVVRERSFDVGSQLPLPKVEDGRIAVRIHNADDINHRMAEQLIDIYRSSLIVEKQPRKTPHTTKTNAWAAIRSFLSDYFRFAIGTPRDWQNELRGNIDRAVSRSVQKQLYGDSHAVDVICGTYGGRISGNPLDSLSEASTELTRGARDRGMSVEDPPSLPELWRGYSQVAQTLVDGTNRHVAGLEPPRDNQHNPAILEQGWMSVPDVADSFNGYHPLLADIVGISEHDAIIHPFDPHRATWYKSQIDFAVTQTPDQSLHALREEFLGWATRYSASFGWKTGQQLAHMISTSQESARTSREEHMELKARLDNYRARDYDGENRKLTRTLRALSLVWLALMLILIYLCIGHYQPDVRIIEQLSGPDWRWYLLIGAVSTAAVMGIQMKILASARRGILAEVQEADLLIANEQIARHNRDAALSDVGRAASAYRQFLSWSVLLGRAIADPLGDQSGTAVSRVLPDNGLPNSTQLGRAVLSEDEITDVVNEMRQIVFPRDWAGKAMVSLIDDAEHSLRRSTGSTVSNLNDLYGQAGSGSGSTLDSLAGTVATAGFAGADRSAEAWSEALVHPGVTRELSRRLSTVEIVRGGELIRIPKEDFLNPLSRTPRSDARFSSDSINAEGVNSGALVVDDTIGRTITTPTDTPQGSLTRSVTVVQYGKLGNLRDLRGTPPAPAPNEPPTFGNPFDTQATEAEGPTFPPSTWDKLI